MTTLLLPRRFELRANATAETPFSDTWGSTIIARICLAKPSEYRIIIESIRKSSQTHQNIESNQSKYQAKHT